MNAGSATEAGKRYLPIVMLSTFTRETCICVLQFGVLALTLPTAMQRYRMKDTMPLRGTQQKTARYDQMSASETAGKSTSSSPW